VRTRAIERKLRSVESAPGEIAQQELGDLPAPDDGDDEAGDQ
jgi:DNA recombination protein RmuC